MTARGAAIAAQRFSLPSQLPEVGDQELNKKNYHANYHGI